MIARIWSRFWKRRDLTASIAMHTKLIAEGKRRHARTDYIETARTALMHQLLAVR